MQHDATGLLVEPDDAPALAKALQQVLADRLVRLGGAWTTFRGARVKVHEAHLVDGALVPTVVQPEGKPRMAFDAWRNGARPSPGEWFE